MIDSVREQLNMNPTVQLIITFVVQQAQVFDVFKAKLKSTTTSRTRSPSPSRLSTQESQLLSYINELIFHFYFILEVNITLTTSNLNIDTAKKLLTTFKNMLNSS